MVPLALSCMVNTAVAPTRSGSSAREGTCKAAGNTAAVHVQGQQARWTRRGKAVAGCTRLDRKSLQPKPDVRGRGQTAKAHDDEAKFKLLAELCRSFGPQTGTDP